MKNIVCAAVLAMAGSSALAGTIVISEIGGGVSLNSGPMASTVFGGTSPVWSEASLMGVHSSINASGISTEGRVTFLAADTDHGLAFLALIDCETGGAFSGNSGNLHMTSVADGQNVNFVNDVDEGFLVTPMTTTSRVALGEFNWDAADKGDGFGWADLVNGNVMTFRFEAIAGAALGLVTDDTFQFVTWNGTGWSLVQIGAGEGDFSTSGEFGFSARVIPLPGAAAMAGLPLCVFAARRRRC